MQANASEYNRYKKKQAQAHKYKQIKASTSKYTSKCKQMKTNPNISKQIQARQSVYVNASECKQLQAVSINSKQI